MSSQRLTCASSRVSNPAYCRASKWRTDFFSQRRTFAASLLSVRAISSAVGSSVIDEMLLNPAAARHIKLLMSL